MCDLRRRCLKVSFYLLGDNFANMLRNRLHNLVRNVGVARRLQPPRFVCSKIHVPQQGACAPALHRDYAGVDVRPTELFYFLNDVAVVYAVERSQTGKETISPPAPYGVPVATHQAVLVGDKSG
jgi:hypothetical protein